MNEKFSVNLPPGVNIIKQFFTNYNVRVGINGKLLKCMKGNRKNI